MLRMSKRNINQGEQKSQITQSKERQKHVRIYESKKKIIAEKKNEM